MIKAVSAIRELDMVAPPVAVIKPVVVRVVADNAPGDAGPYWLVGPVVDAIERDLLGLRKIKPGGI